jgi:hypothetical protein
MEFWNASTVFGRSDKDLLTMLEQGTQIRVEDSMGVEALCRATEGYYVAGKVPKRCRAVAYTARKLARHTLGENVEVDGLTELKAALLAADGVSLTSPVAWLNRICTMRPRDDAKQFPSFLDIWIMEVEKYARLEAEVAEAAGADCQEDHEGADDADAARGQAAISLQSKIDAGRQRAAESLLETVQLHAPSVHQKYFRQHVLVDEEPWALVQRVRRLTLNDARVQFQTRQLRAGSTRSAHMQGSLPKKLKPSHTSSVVTTADLDGLRKAISSQISRSGNNELARITADYERLQQRIRELEDCNRQNEPTVAAIALPRGDRAYQREVCLDFQRGRCSRPACRFEHVPASPSRKRGWGVCYAFQEQGQCSYGADCRFEHAATKTTTASPSKRRRLGTGHPSPRKAMCYGFQNTGSCRWGKTCRFRHVSDETPQPRKRGQCQPYLRGLCNRGNSCDFEHSRASRSAVVAAISAIHDAQDTQTPAPSAPSADDLQAGPAIINPERAAMMNLN